MKFSKSSFDCLVEKYNLSTKATSSLKDFKAQLTYLGSDVLNEEAFNVLLNNIGYERSREGLFESLLKEIAPAEADRLERFITVDDIAKLYGSDSYHLLDNGKDSGDSLMDHVDKIFHEHDHNGDALLTKEEFHDFFLDVMGPGSTVDEADEAFHFLDRDKSGEIDLDEFKTGILRYIKNQSSELPRSFNYTLVSPTLTTSNEFVSALEHFTKNHQAVDHHLLENIACASFGNKNTADILLFFLSAYAKFNSGFVGSVEKLIDILENPNERDVLHENLMEEMGSYEEETLIELEDMGIPRQSIQNISHHQLFLDLVNTIERKLKCSYFDFISDDLMAEMVTVQTELALKGKTGLLALLYFGSELIVPRIYSSLLGGLRLCLNLTPEESRFLILHISMDCDHADNIRSIIVNHCKTTEDRIELVKFTETVLNARVAFYEKLVGMNNTKTLVKTSKLYDKQATRWCREKPLILSDFTGRPVVYDLISEHIRGASVLDVGCGEGFVTRKMTEMGAVKVVGIDISPGMIDCAKSHHNKSSNEFFLVGDASALKQNLLDQLHVCNLMPGTNFDIGVFDLSVAVFLFNYMSIFSMNKTFENVYSLLKPGGHFVFSVPHPFMAFHNTSTFGFHSDSDSAKYFALRDKCLEGHIGTIGGDKLNVRMHFKTIEDYLNAVTLNGFEVISFTEARVRAEDMANNSPFFSDVNGYPLHIVMKVRKPTSTSKSVALGAMNTLDILPKKLNWPRTVPNNVENSLVMQLTSAANNELTDAALQVYDKGISVDDLDIGSFFVGKEFSATKTFASSVRNRLLHETGAVIIKGLDMSVLGGADQLDKMTACSKIAYLLICEHIGSVDATSRGKLFDVKSANIDAMSKTADNVLFSVSDTEAGWHTDGASKDRVYDVVALLCITPAAEGGKFRISNACDVYDELSRSLPKFLMYELIRAIPRDVLEAGDGKGTVGAATALSRSAALLAMRIKYNSYPIYAVEGDRMRFRYMRHWIETGHEKAFWKIPTLLRIAMDILDDHLNKACCFHQALERGDMVFANNAMLAHARDGFKNDPDAPPRHKVRAWIQVQKADIARNEA